MDGSNACTNNLRFKFSGQPPKTEIAHHLPEIHNWAHPDRAEDKCGQCPVVSFCMGGCPYLTGEAHHIDCMVKKHHFGGLLKVFVSKILQRKIDRLDFQEDICCTVPEKLKVIHECIPGYFLDKNAQN